MADLSGLTCAHQRRAELWQTFPELLERKRGFSEPRGFFLFLPAKRKPILDLGPRAAFSRGLERHKAANFFSCFLSF